MRHVIKPTSAAVSRNLELRTRERTALAAGIRIFQGYLEQNLRCYTNLFRNESN